MLEFLLALLAGILGALAVRTFEWLLDRAEIVTPLFPFLAYVSFGAAAGFSERVAPPHPLVHRSGVPGIGLSVSPTLAGLGMVWVGSPQRRHDKKATQIESFTYGFAFALGMATVGFFVAKQFEFLK